jgi:trk system potassium uptake protein TrkH
MLHNHNKPPMSPSKVLAAGFLAIILTGAALLTLPISAEPGVRITPFQALFTATSAVCVTGLTVVDTATSFSLFGEAVILLLIQTGGLGFMIFATFFLVLAGRRISLRGRMLLHDTASLPSLSGSVRITMRFMLIVLAVELAGAAILAVRFIPLLGLWRGLYYGVFHAVSAFCNAGFDLFGSAGSLTGFANSPTVLLTISSLIILGGLGFAVLADVVDVRFAMRKLHLHSKAVLATTAALLVLGTLVVALVEWDNPATLAKGGAAPMNRVMNAWFQSVTSRTAGFYSFSQPDMRNAGKLVTILLMFIGASPASTGGGIKTTTLFTIVMLARSLFRGCEDVTVFRRRLPASLIRTVLAIFFISLLLLFVGSVYMSVAEQAGDQRVIDLVFEETSALATVGLSAASTPTLRMDSQAWLILLMYFGRVGPLTMMLSLSRRSATRAAGARYPEEQIIVG